MSPLSPIWDGVRNQNVSIYGRNCITASSSQLQIPEISNSVSFVFDKEIKVFLEDQYIEETKRCL